MGPAEISEKIQSFRPWFYDFDLGLHGRTESKLPVEMQEIHSTRLQMVNSVLDRDFPGYLARSASCLDIACHEGFFSIELAKRGFRRVLGIDVRGESLEKARFVAEVLGFEGTKFQTLNAEEVSPAVVGEFDVTLFLGLLYHLENPMLCLRRAAAVTKRVCILETQVIDEVEGETEWGSIANRQRYQGVLALIDEAAEFYANSPEMGATPLVTCPSPKGLVTMLRHAGFSRVEFVAPPAGAYEQLARGKRVVCAAYKA